jgi:protein TonB
MALPLTGTGIAIAGHGLLIAAFFLATYLSAKPSIELAHPVTVRFMEAPPKPQVQTVQTPPQEVVPLPKVEPVPKPLPKPMPKPVIVPTAHQDAPSEKAVAVPPAESPAAVTSVEPPAPPAPVQTEAKFDAAYLNNPKPIYPPSSRRMGETGRVLLRVRVGEDGQPLEVTLKKSSGSPRLDQSAEDAVNHWKFVPARSGDTPVVSWVVVPLDFSLDEN